MVFKKLTSLFAMATFVASLSTSAYATPRVDSGVHRALRKQGAVNLIVTMKERPKKTLESLHEATFISRGDMIADMVEKLEQHSASSQQPVAALLAQESESSELYKDSKSFWISNQVYIEGASGELVKKLSALPSVLEVREEQILPLPRIIIEEAATNATANAEWGVELVKATDVWGMGNTGEGIVVSNVDTGVRGTHEALKDNYRKDHGWFDPEKKAADPYDPNGHGTHTMGTIAGSKGVGVAPGAQWIACKGCRSNGCSESDLLTCAQFITCPTDTNGENKDCSKAPHVVSNSWGGGQGDTFYQNAVDTWIQAGIVPVFANGNSGPSCGTANSPGDYANVIAVGATDNTDALARFSSKGPAKSGLLKPDISAPGANVRSAWNSGDTSYNSISGTSMACPHVSGCVALLLKAKPGLKFDDVRKILTGNTDKNLKSTGQTCGDTPDDKFPNNNFGYGRVNVLKAVKNDGVVPTPSPSNPPPGPAPTPTRTPTPKPPTPSSPSDPSHCSAFEKHNCFWFFGCYWDKDANKCLPWY